MTTTGVHTYWYKWLLSALLITATPCVIAQTTVPDTLVQEETEMIREALDSLATLHVSDETQAATTPIDSIPVFSDSVYAYRLSLLPSPIALDYNDIVKRYIDMYLVQKRSQVSKMVGLSALYMPIFEEVLDKYDLPLELKYLPVIESALNPHAVSRVGATGLWQFMYPTGRLYNLTINSLVDERRDPYLATDAAARFLKDLYELYGSWTMALAAYNCGPGNVNKAIRRSGGKTTYWEIRDYLPRETRGYVPAFIAATYAMNYYESHLIQPLVPEWDIKLVDTVLIRAELPLDIVAGKLDITVEELAFYNPALKRQVVPFVENGYPLRLPMDMVASFDTFRDTILAEAAARPQAPSSSSPQFTSARSYSSSASSAYSSYTPNTDGKTKLTYTIKSGDNLGYIATWYNCSIQDIQAWNNLRSSRIYAGQKLAIYVPDNKVEQYRGIDNMSLAQKQSLSGTATTTTTSAAPATTSTATGNLQEYTIQAGDTLWDIARKFPKNTVDDIKRINGITDPRELRPGRIIKLKV